MTTIITNGHERELLYFSELTDEERDKFDDDDSLLENVHDYVRYKGEVYCTDEFLVVPNVMREHGWDGIITDTFFSGILVKFTDDGEAVIMGRYYEDGRQ